MSQDWNSIDWSFLERLRDGFLAGQAAPADYWTTDAQLAAYDLTFAARIGWKWDFVLSELRRRGWSPPPGPVLDWGCGTAIASRRLVHHFGPAAVPELVLFDRSDLAVAFAVARFREELPAVAVSTLSCSPALPSRPLAAASGTLLVSHVLTELSPLHLDALIALAAQFSAVIWIEPGNYDSSRLLITAVRERLRDRFAILAPCTHQETCGLLVPENARHWCHQFAPSPPEIHQDANWSRFARTVGVDLRSLPLSFLVLGCHPQTCLRVVVPPAETCPNAGPLLHPSPLTGEGRVRVPLLLHPSPLGEGGPSGPGEGLRPETLPSPDAAASLPLTALRLLGRPRMEKARALLFLCDASGVRDRRFLKRRDPAAFRLARHDELASLLLCRLDGDEILELRPAVM